MKLYVIKYKLPSPGRKVMYMEVWAYTQADAIERLPAAHLAHYKWTLKNPVILAKFEEVV